MAEHVTMRFAFWFSMVVLVAGLSGCTRTRDLWYSTTEKTDDFQSNALAIQYLDDGERVAVLPPAGKLQSNQIAIVYRIPKDFPGLQQGIKSVSLYDVIRVDYTTNKIEGEGHLQLVFDSGKEYTLRGAPILTERSANEVQYRSDKITFHRSAYFRGVPKSDFEKLMRVPLTPVTVTMDLSEGAIEVTEAIVLAPLWIPLFIAMAGNNHGH